MCGKPGLPCDAAPDSGVVEKAKNMVSKLHVPFDEIQAKQLKAGDRVLISGTVYTARDAAHQRLHALLQQGESLPVNFENQIIFYTGPGPAKPCEVIGPTGPTSCYRMDKYTPDLIRRAGLRGMIGKGSRSAEVKQAMMECGAVCFAAIGGAAALLAECVTSCSVVAYPDLATEAIHRLEVVDFPAVVAMDVSGADIYTMGRERYLESLR